MKKLNFVCPECKGTTLVIEQDATELQEIDGLEVIGDFEYLAKGDVYETNITDVFEYKCANCDFEIADSEEEAVTWLKERGMLGEEVGPAW